MLWGFNVVGVKFPEEISKFNFLIFVPQPQEIQWARRHFYHRGRDEFRILEPSSKKLFSIKIPNPGANAQKSVYHHCMQMPAFLKLSKLFRFAATFRNSAVLLIVMKCNCLTIITCALFIYGSQIYLLFLYASSMNSVVWRARRKMSVLHIFISFSEFNFVASVSMFTSAIRWNLLFDNKFTLHDYCIL